MKEFFKKILSDMKQFATMCMDFSKEVITTYQGAREWVSIYKSYLLEAGKIIRRSININTQSYPMSA